MSYVGDVSARSHSPQSVARLCVYYGLILPTYYCYFWAFLSLATLGLSALMLLRHTQVSVEDVSPYEGQWCVRYTYSRYLSTVKRLAVFPTREDAQGYITRET